MEDLKSGKCEVCRAGVPAIGGEEAQRLLAQIPDWRITADGQVNKLMRAFTFKDFTRTMQAVNAVAAAAEEQGHHPVMRVEYNRLTVWWWTHKIAGLHRNDFIMAAKTDALLTAGGQ